MKTEWSDLQEIKLSQEEIDYFDSQEKNNMKDKVNVTTKFCPEDIMSLDGIKDYITSTIGDNNKAYLNKYNGPIWMDYSPGSYVDKDGNTVYKSEKKCEYVDKELIRIIVKKIYESMRDKDSDSFTQYSNALVYFIEK